MSEDLHLNSTVTSLGLGGRGAHLVIPSIVAPIIACCLVANRIYWRLRMVGNLGLDDVSTILALVFLFVQCGASVAAVNFGYGRALNTMNLHQASQALKCFFLLQIFYKLTINCTKLSILFLYLRIFTDRPWFSRTCWCLIVLVFCACTCFTSATIFQCSPVRAAWQRWDLDSRCVDIYTLWYSNAIYNILTDFTLVLMVPPVIFKLKLPLRQKLALSCIFGLGVIVCAASISRLTTLYSSAYGHDATAGSLVSTSWTTIEAGLGVICANLPMMRTPLQHLFPKLFPPRMSTDHVSSTSLSHSNGLHSNGSLASLPNLTAVSLPSRSTSLPHPSFVAGGPACPPKPGPGNLQHGTIHPLQVGHLANCGSIEAGGHPPTYSGSLHTIVDHVDDWYSCAHKVW